MTAKSGTTHPHRTFTNDPRNVEEAAWWIAMEGKTDAEVADIMQCPVRHIATMRRNAWARGLIFGFDRTRVTDKAHLRYLDSIGLQGRLERHLRTAHRNFRELKIFDSGSEGQSPHDILQRLQQFSNNAGPWLKTLLKRASTVGVSWGLTLRLAVAELAKVDVGKPSRAIEVVPTCGELLGTSAGDTSSSSIAAQLAAAMNAHGKHSLSLAGTPAMIAQRFQASGNLAVIQEFLKESPAYTAIFINRPKGARPWVEEIDTMLTSVATTVPLRMAGLELLEIANVEKSKVCSLVGDIGGVLLQGSGLDEAKQVEVDSIRQLWTGIQPHHYRRIAASGGAQRGGVVVLAIDANKCDAALRAIELGWVTRLACDRHLAAAIAKRCDVPLKLQRAGS